MVKDASSIGDLISNHDGKYKSILKESTSSLSTVPEEMVQVNPKLTGRKLAWMKERNVQKESSISEARSDALYGLDCTVLLCTCLIPENVKSPCIMNYVLLLLFTMGNRRRNTVLSRFCILICGKGFVFFAQTTVNMRFKYIYIFSNE